MNTEGNTIGVTQNPVILPKSSHITALGISYAHIRTHHSGRGVALNELRTSGYWVVGGNSTVRQFISKCVTCRYLRGTMAEQKMADLPKSRVEPAPPFTQGEVDFFGFGTYNEEGLIRSIVYLFCK